MLKYFQSHFYKANATKYYRMHGETSWFDWHRPYIKCYGIKKYFFAFCGLFIGYLPYHFYSDAFVLIKRHHHKIFYHYCWVIDAWESDL